MMPLRRPPDSTISVTTVLFALFLFAHLPFFADAQQQHSLRQNDAAYTQLQRGKSTWTEGKEDDNNNPINQRARRANHHQQQHHYNRNNNAAYRTTDVRALATFAPSGRLNHNGDVRASPAQSGTTTAGLSSRQPTRSLQDWEVEDIVLLATVDGMVYAKERKTGKHLWAFGMDRPMVETVYHQKDQTGQSGSEQSNPQDFYWIVEPSQDGALYGYTPGSPFGMQKLGLTVKQLVDELAPYAAEDPPVVYTGEKKTTLFTVNVQTGAITKTFSPSRPSMFEEEVCMQEDDLDTFDAATCLATGTFVLGRTDYTVVIQSSLTGRDICTIRYSEWVPNMRDRDLHSQYTSSKDNRYVYSLHDGRVFALDHFDGGYFEQKPRYQHKLESPVVRVFDVARPTESSTTDAPLVILPQPITPVSTEGQYPLDDPRIFVNCTAAGSWYALSETKYPHVTDGVQTAQAALDDWIYDLPHLAGSVDEQLKKALVGVHALSYAEVLPKEVPLITGPEDVPKTISGYPSLDNGYTQDTLLLPRTPQSKTNSFTQGLLGLIVIACLLALSYAGFTDRGFGRRKIKQFIQPLVDFTPEGPVEIKKQVEVLSDRLQTEAEGMPMDLPTTALETEPEVAQVEAEAGVTTQLEAQVDGQAESVGPQKLEEPTLELAPIDVQVEQLKELPEQLGGPEIEVARQEPVQEPVVIEAIDEISKTTEAESLMPAAEAIHSLPISEAAVQLSSTEDQGTNSVEAELTPLSASTAPIVSVVPEEPVVPTIPATSTPPPPPTTPTPKPKKKAHRGKRGGKKLKDDKESPDEAIEDVDAVGEGVTKVGDVVAVTPQAVYETDGRTNLNGLVFNENEAPIGSGSGGTLVYSGEWEGRPVAVKRMQHVHFELAQQEIEILGHSEEHPNVIRYKCTRQNKDFLFIGLELCQGSLYDLWGNGPGQMPLPDSRYGGLANDIGREPVKALKQLAEGMKYLHSFRIVHRDIKPQNILIAYAKNFSTSTYPRLVISDFGLCKVLPNDTSTLLGATIAAAGTHGWKAPELINQPVMSGSQNSASNSSLTGADGQGGTSLGVRRACDIFSLGCVFFYVLTHGQHPFEDPEGWSGLRERNIKLNRSNFEPIEMYGADTTDLIRWMLSPRPEDRPTAAQVLAHPFFWNAEDRLEFLSLASDRFDQEPRDGTSIVLDNLESRAEDIIPRINTSNLYSSIAAQHKRLPDGRLASEVPAALPDYNFLAVLDRKFTDTLGKQRKYNGAKLADLLRALRNKHHHWDDMPEDVKARVGEVPEGYLAYWEGKFPGLVVGVWRVARECGIGGERRFNRWFIGKGG